MSTLPHLVGMVHLMSLPGSPGYAGSMDDVVERAVADAGKLTEAGFPALLVENYGDVPFYADSVPPETTSAMTAAIVAVRNEVPIPIGVNVLRNDALSAVGIAAATGAAFIRVNVLTGVMYTDQGPLVGKAAEVMRQKERIAPDLEVWADVMVKHATAPPGTSIGQVASDTVERGLADAVIVSGGGTGLEPDLEQAANVRSAVPTGTRVVIGSGATVGNLADVTRAADTVIVGSSIKESATTTNPVDPDRASHFVKVAKELGLV